MEPGWRIGDWVFESRRHVLRRGNQERRIEPKAAAVLARLVSATGRVVTKQELFDAVWPGLIVTDEVLPNAVYQIRRALDDDARAPRYVETVPKVGYRVVAEVEALSATRTEPPPRPIARPSRPAGWATLGAAAALLVLGVGIARWSTTEGPAAARVDPADLVARGWAVLEQSSPGAGREAAALATAALEADPTNADAWALAATSWSALASAGEIAAADGYGRARQAAATALGLDPGHVGALQARAVARWLGDWDWEGAESDLLAALEVAPDDSRTLARYAEMLLLRGRLDEASRAVTRAVDRDPGSIPVRLTAALVATMNATPELAERHYRSILAHHPEHAAARTHLAKLEGAPSGRSGEVRSDEERLAGLTSKERVRPGHLALWFVEAGRPAEALEWLERAVAERDTTILFFRFDPRWDPWRNHPRYRAAMSAAGLAPAS
ncbi:MAG TPA: winged helix-turn-helix domain-containing protein [Thermoanaerobaculia bacterium]|nr:winged helix-turn-helix domain-containing protein [Thermoanaerobaculia bacterium]